MSHRLENESAKNLSHYPPDAGPRFLTAEISLDRGRLFEMLSGQKTNVVSGARLWRCLLKLPRSDLKELEAFDDLIMELHDWEGIRYPEKLLEGGGNIRVSAILDLKPDEMTRSAEPPPGQRDRIAFGEPNGAAKVPRCPRASTGICRRKFSHLPYQLPYGPRLFVE